MVRKEHLLTPQGLARLEEELARLRKVRLPEVAENIRQARETGGTTENSEYEEARNEWSFVQGRIRKLEGLIKRAVVVEFESGRENAVTLGSRVRVRNQDGKEEVYHLVGSLEASPLEGRISHESPVGQALLGRRVGEEVEVAVPAGVLRLLVTGVD